MGISSNALAVEFRIKSQNGLFMFELTERKNMENHACPVLLIEQPHF
jgi:hypothetical protein